MLEYWLRGRGNRALLQSQSTTWELILEGCYEGVYGVLAFEGYKKRQLNLLKKRERKKKTKTERIPFKKWISHYRKIRAKIKLSDKEWTTTSEKERETRKGLAMMMGTRPQFFLGQWLPWCESLKINGGMCEQHRGRLLWCLSSILSKSSL